MRNVLIAILLVIATPTFAANRVIILNDAEQQALLNALDDSTRAKGLAAAEANLHLLNKLRSAPTQVEETPKTTPPTEPKNVP